MAAALIRYECRGPVGERGREHKLYRAVFHDFGSYATAVLHPPDDREPEDGISKIEFASQKGIKELRTLVRKYVERTMCDGWSLFTEKEIEI
jgi:hypothetical protein